MSNRVWSLGLIVDDPASESAFVVAALAAGTRVERIRDFGRAAAQLRSGELDGIVATFPPSATWIGFLRDCAARSMCVWLAPTSRVEEAYTRGMAGSTGDDAEQVFAHAVLSEAHLGADEVRRAMLAAEHVRRLQDATRRSVMRESEAASLAQMVIENSASVVFRWRTSSGSPVAYVSDNVRIFGYTPEEVTAPGFFYQSIVHPEDLEAALRQIKQCREDGVDTFTLSYRILTHDGDVRWVEDRTRVVRGDDGEPTFHQGVVTDVTDQREAEEQRQILSQAVEQSPGSVAIADLRGRIRYVNPRYCGLSGYGREAIEGRELIGFTLDADPHAHRALWQAVWQGGSWRGEVRKRRRDGDPYWELLSISPIRDSRGTITHFLEVGEDITERRKAEEAIRQMAFHDSLTQLPNRTLFNDRLAQALPRAKREQRIAAVLFLDLDRFKLVNDTLGHAAGDALLREVAVRLRAAVREGDTVARMAGDEFLVLLPSLERASSAERVARKIVAALEAPFELASGPYRTSTSVGIALFPDDGDDAETLLKCADHAMYRAKEGGRGRACFYSHPSDAGSARGLTLRDLMLQALARDEFELLYQPVVDLAHGTVVALEALIRWNHPDRGPMMPADFLPLAESGGVSGELDKWVVRTAVAASQRWRAAGLPPVRISCNLVGRQIGGPGFVEGIFEGVEWSSLGEGGIEVEVDARDLAAAGAAGREAVQAMRTCGVRIALGGVAEAEWSLQRLRALTIDAIKLERDLVRQLTHSREAVALARGLVGMAQTMQIDCIAQGVESHDAMQSLRGIGCRYAQGFLLSLPLREHELPALFGRVEPDWSGSVTGVHPVPEAAERTGLSGSVRVADAELSVGSHVGLPAEAGTLGELGASERWTRLPSGWGVPPPAIDESRWGRDAVRDRAGHVGVAARATGSDEG